MDRRGFLKSILALGAAPAIVKAESLMPLLVPKRYFDGVGDYVPFTTDLLTDHTMETVVGNMDTWHHVAMTRSRDGLLSYFIDGVKVAPDDCKAVTGGKVLDYKEGKLTIRNETDSSMYIAEIRVTDGLHRMDSSDIFDFQGCKPILGFDFET